jgi:hypothetical protein
MAAAVSHEAAGISTGYNGAFLTLPAAVCGKILYSKNREKI